MNTVVVWLWNGQNLGDRPYMPEHVNRLRAQVAHNMRGPHRFVCVADSAKGFDSGVDVMLTPPAAAQAGKHRTPEGSRFPSCYRRLWTFSRDATVLGDKVLLLDIDALILGPLDHLFAHEVDFMGWRPYRDWGTKLRFGGGTYMLRTGTRTSVWENFKGAASIQRARAAGFRGSDQAWISHCLAGREPYFDIKAGIYSVRDLGPGQKPPPHCCVLHFNGPVKPWTSPVQWVKDHYRGRNPAGIVATAPGSTP